MIRTTIIAEPEWIEAATGDAVSAIAIGVRLLSRHVIGAAEIDLALSAALACAIEGDATSPVLISSALRRRSKIDPACRCLSELWRDARF
ncbi:2-methylaconitate cis-trans-isomerase PrpF [Nitrobacteraceae bacterium AZCC 2299]